MYSSSRVDYHMSSLDCLFLSIDIDLNIFVLWWGEKVKRSFELNWKNVGTTGE